MVIASIAMSSQYKLIQYELIACLESNFRLKSNRRSEYSLPMVSRISSNELEKAYEKHGAAVLRVSYAILRNKSEAEDLVHDVFLRFWKSGKFDSERGNDLSYLLTLTKSMAINLLNQKKNRTNILKKWKNVFNPEKIKNEDLLEQAENTAKIQLALSKLSEPQRKVLDFCYIQGQSHQATAKILKIPLGTVKTNARRGLIQLKKHLKINNGGSI